MLTTIRFESVGCGKARCGGNEGEKEDGGSVRSRKNGEEKEEEEEELCV